MSEVRVLILYYSAGGSTRQLAKHIALGIEQQGAEAVMRCVAPVSTIAESTADRIPQEGDVYASLDDLLQCDGLIVGSPTRFGNMAAPLKYFIDQTSELWMTGKLANKPVSFFTSSSSLHGGQESTLLTMMLPFLHHGMVICGLPYSETDLIHTTSGGTPYGASHLNAESNNYELSQHEKNLAVAQGKRMAMFSKKLKSNL